MPTIKQGEVWDTLLPWQAMGREIRWHKPNNKRSPRKVYIPSSNRINRRGRTLVAPITKRHRARDRAPFDFEHSDNHVVYGGSVLCGQLQGFPVFLETDALCDSGAVLKTGESPFYRFKDTFHYQTNDILTIVDKVLSGKGAKNVRFGQGRLLAVRFSPGVSRPCVVLDSGTDVPLVTVAQTLPDYSPEDEKDDIYRFVIFPEENSLSRHLTVGLPLVRTVDISRVDPTLSLGQLSSDRTLALTSSIRTLMLSKGSNAR